MVQSIPRVHNEHSRTTMHLPVRRICNEYRPSRQANQLWIPIKAAEVLGPACPFLSNHYSSSAEDAFTCCTPPIHEHRATNPMKHTHPCTCIHANTHTHTQARTPTTQYTTHTHLHRHKQKRPERTEEQKSSYLPSSGRLAMQN